MRIDPLDFSQARVAPDDVIRGLELLDPTACLVHLGGTRWVVGKLRPNAEARRQAEAMLAHWTASVRAGKRLSPRGALRVRFAQLALLGFRPVQQYEIVGEPDGRIVQDFARSRYHWLTTSDNAVQHSLDTAHRDRAEAAHAELASVDRAKDAWKHAFTLTHTTSVSLTPPDTPKSGFVRHPKPSPAASPAA
jgi:hypothetical protein